MFEWKLMTLAGAQGWLASGWATHCVSLVDPGTSVQTRAPQHLVLEFEDVGKNSRRGTASVPPDASHIEQILAFTSALGDSDRLLIHCHGCYGRSPAAALGVLVQHGRTVDEAYALVRGIRPHCDPNALMLDLFDDRLGLGDPMGPRTPGGILLPTWMGSKS